MSTAFLGTIRLAGFNFAPVGSALCQGQSLPISQNTALFSLLGTYFGGDGRQTFNLPDLRAGLSAYTIGQSAGVETVQIAASNYPTRSHTLTAAASTATQNAPAGLIEAEGQTGGRGGTLNLALYSASGSATALAPGALVSAPGGNQPHNNLQPYLALNFCIALQGIFPARS